MLIHHRIVHHVRKHKERIIAHVNKHQKKYIFGAGVVSGRAVTKFIAFIIIFLGMSKMSGTTGADYYDAEFYNSLTGNKINISNQVDSTDDILRSQIDTGYKQTSGNAINGKTGAKDLYLEQTTQGQ